MPATPTFNAQFNPATDPLAIGSWDIEDGSPEQGNWRGAFSGLGFVQSAYKNPDGTFTVIRTRPGSTDPYDGQMATVSVGPNGQVNVLGGESAWQAYKPDSNSKFFGQMALTGLALGGGLAAGGFFGGAGAAGAGAGAAAAPGAGAIGETAAAGLGALEAPVTLAGGGASLSSPITLGGAAIGDAGLSTAGALGGGIGGGLAPSTIATLGAGAGAGAAALNTSATNPALIESAAGTPGYGASSAGAGGGAGTSSLPSWLNGSTLNTAGKLLSLGGMAGSAASGSGGADVDKSAGDALKALGLEQAGIAREQYAQGKADRAAFDPKFAAILDSALQQMQQQGQRSDVTWNSYVSNFLPNAEKFAQTALNYDTAGRRAAEEARARAGVEAEATLQRQAQGRALGRAGVSIDSGRALTLDNAARLATTKLSTGAASAARRGVETTGLALNRDAAVLGNSVAGLSQQQAGQSQQAGQVGTGTLTAQQATRNAALAPAQAFYGGATSATSAAAGNANAQASLGLQSDAQKNAGWAGLGSLAGTLLTAPKDSIIGGWLSDPKSKRVHGKVSGKKALLTLGGEEVYDYTYRRGMGDGGRHTGRMAGERDAMGEDGMRRVDLASEIGLHHAAINELAREVKRLTLADARG